MDKELIDQGGDNKTSVCARGVVKWFSASKGFGFIYDQANTRDVFVHAEALKKSGYTHLEQGDWIDCTVEAGSKGVHVQEITSIERIDQTSGEKILDQSSSKRVKFNGKVKWFDAAKGYGFITSSSGEEIFIGAKLLKSLGLTPPLRKDQAVKISAEKTERGWVAQTITFEQTL